MSVTIDYYISLNSPWTYMGSALFAEVARRNGATVNVKPAKFGPIFEKTGGLPLPKRSPERRAYRLMELKRWREVRDIPLILQPKNSPSDDAAATRLVIAAKLQGKDAHRLATELGRALWEMDQPLDDPAVMAAAAIICPYSEVYAPCTVRSPGGRVCRVRSLRTRSGQRKSFQLPRKVMMPSVARAGRARGRAM